MLREYSEMSKKSKDMGIVEEELHNEEPVSLTFRTPYQMEMESVNEMMDNLDKLPKVSQSTHVSPPHIRRTSKMRVPHQITFDSRKYSML